MKKRMKATKSPQHARTAVLTEQDLASVVGGTEGTIIVENLIARPQGIQGTGSA